MTRDRRSAAPETLAQGAPDLVPALLLGRLTVDHRYRNLGIRTALVSHSLATALELNQKAEYRAVVVIAVTLSAILWERRAFHPFDPDDPDQLDLYP